MMVNKTFLAAAVALGLGSAAHAEEHIIVLTGFSYFPAITYADTGDTVIFVNESGEAQTVVGKDSGWTIGPLANEEEGTLQIEDGTELLFFAAYCNEENVDANGNCGQGTGGQTTGSGDDNVAEETNHGTYEGAPIRAEISLEVAPLEG